ncbi:MAG: formylglycine-generating enzyme family protein [Bacteroidia bacterium]
MISKKCMLICFIFMTLSCKRNEIKEDTEAKPALKENTGYTSIPFSIIENRVLIKKGNYTPLYGTKKSVDLADDFMMDVYPVTNANYVAFVKCYPQWRRSNVKKMFADGNYLTTWKNDTTLEVGQLPNAPVTNVSWFAANAYCKSIGTRLPTMDEWEYVAMANENSTDARKDSTYNQYILEWYEKQDTYKNEVGKTYKNRWGVYDMHGLVWEWTEDFNSVMLGGENRGDAGSDKNLFCGSGSLSANDLMNYAAFMRYAFRSSMKANYAVQNLGFRGVKDIKK